MKKMFIFVAIAGLAFASCKKDDLGDSFQGKSVQNNIKTVLIQGQEYYEYVDDVTGQTYFQRINNENLPKEVCLDKELRKEYVPNRGVIYTCKGVGAACGLGTMIIKGKETDVILTKDKVIIK